MKKQKDSRVTQDLSSGYRQWHLPFQTVLNLSLKPDEGHYIISPERELTRKPLRVDFFILKLDEDYQMKSSLGRLLKKHTIMEYKGATDYLSLPDLFKGQAYASLYLSSGTGDTVPDRSTNNASADSLSSSLPGPAASPEEVLLMFVCYPYPRKVMQFLEHTAVEIEEVSPGIYRFRIWFLDVIILVQSRLNGAEYLWLKNLSSNVLPEDFDRMAAQQQTHPEDKSLDDLIQFIYDNNPYLQKEGEKMCKVFDDVRQRGIEIGEYRLSRLIQLLLEDGRVEDISAVTRDEKVRCSLYKEYGL